MAKIVTKVTEILNGGRDALKAPPFLVKWQSIYYNTSVHTTGVCPAYYPLEWDKPANRWIAGNSLFYPFYWLYPQYDIVFERLYSAHPREPQITREWRKSQYRAYQRAPLLQAMDKCKAVISADNKYTLQVADKEDNEYIWGKNFDGRDLVGFMFWHFKTICEDPNGLFIVAPDRPAKEQKGSKVTCKIMFVPTRRILFYSEDELIFLETDNLCWYVNGMSYLRFEKGVDEQWSHMDGRDGYYAHSLGRIPVHFGGGIWNTHGFYDSYISPAIPFCDDFVGALSAVQMVNKEASHPFIIAASSKCTKCNGSRQEQGCKTCHQTKGFGCNCIAGTPFELRECGACHGTGVQSVNPADWTIVPPDQMGNDMIKIVNPDVSVNEYLNEFRKDIYEGIRQALHQSYIDEAQSGVAKEIDREGERLWYKACSDGMWGLLEAILLDILSIRNISKSDGKVKPNIPEYTLIPPTDFDIKTESDLLDQYKVATESKIPDYVRQRINDSLVDKTYGGDDIMVKTSQFITYVDPYSVKTDADKDICLTSGVVDRDTIMFSNVLPMLLNKLALKRGKEWFIKASFDDMEIAVRELFAVIPKPAAPVAATVKEVV